MTTCATTDFEVPGIPVALAARSCPVLDHGRQEVSGSVRLGFNNGNAPAIKTRQQDNRKTAPRRTVT
jgi:hypothetical protein